MRARLLKWRADLADLGKTYLMVLVITPGFIAIGEHFDGLAAAWRSILWMGVVITALWTWRR